MLKQNKGITLVALVITIIVLLILAGVSISLVVGENGVLSRATGAAEKTKRSQLKEAMDLALEDCQTEFAETFTNDATTTVADIMTPIKASKALQKNNYGLYKDSKGKTPVEDTDKWKDEEATELNTFYIKGSSKDVLGVQVEIRKISETDDFAGAYPKYAKNLGEVSETNKIEE